MHTISMIAFGLVLLVVFAGIGRARGALTSAILAFLIVWLLVTIGNVWVGVTQAGYTIAQELPINTVVYSVPAFAAFLVRKFCK
ncbi:MAG: hypothetical protein ABL898_05600 [Hyphomicrobiaceae bacterium]